MEFKLLKIINKSRIKLLKKIGKIKKIYLFKKREIKIELTAQKKIRKIENKFFIFDRKNGVVKTKRKNSYKSKIILIQNVIGDIKNGVVKIKNQKNKKRNDIECDGNIKMVSSRKKNQKDKYEQYVKWM